MSKNILLRIKREQLVESGAYDGRYTTKVIPNKKKEETKKRVKIRPHDVV